MKKIYYFFAVTFCAFFLSTFSIKGQAGCDLNLIRSTFTGAGCTELTACLSSCSMYFYNPISQTGNNAQIWAQNYGANLISLQSATENACIVSELNANSFGGVIWIGFNDVANEGSHVWYDQSPIVYTNWNGGEPNNSGNEDCVQIYPDGKWNDLNCSSGGSKSVIEVNLCPVTTITPSETSVCAGENVSLPTTTYLGSAPYTYSWTSVPTGFTATSANPTVTPTVTTTYNVIATDRYGCLSQSNVTITVNNPSTAITPNGPTSFCSGGSVDLTAGAASSYSWSNGATTQTITVNANGNFTVVSTDGNGCTATSAPTAVSLYDNPVAAFNNTAVCFQNANQFTDASSIGNGNISLRNWNFGDGSFSSQQSPAHTYATCGVFNVKLVVTSDNGCKDSISKITRVYCLPVADFSFTDVCLNQVMDFIDLSLVPDDTVNSSTPDDSVTAWTWYFGDGSALSTAQNVSHTYSNAGLFPASLISTSSNGCMDTIIKSVKVHPLPDAKFSTDNVCDGSTVPFTDLSTIAVPGLILYRAWDFGDGSPFSSVPTTSHQYSAAGPYTAGLLVVSDFGCMDSITKTVIIHPNPVVNFAADDTTGCAPLCISFQNLSVVSSGNIAQYTWDVGDGSPAVNSQNFDHCYANLSVNSSAYFNVALTVTSDSGCVTTGIKNNYITVYPNPVADFSVEPPNTTLINPVISFKDASAGVDTWIWDFGDGSTTVTTGLGYPSIPNPTSYTYADTGTYLATLITTTQYGCIDSAYKTILIEPDFVFYIPEAFSPNGDSKNDFFAGKGLFIKEYEMTIYDRWGNLVYKTTDVNQPWDGKASKGSQVAQSDVYIYSFTITDIRMEMHLFKGIVTLVR